MSLSSTFTGKTKGSLFLLFTLSLLLTRTAITNVRSIQKNPVSANKESSSSDATGLIFSGKWTRHYHGPRVLQGDLPRSKLPFPTDMNSKTALICKNWAVVTTIFAPSDAVKIASKLVDSCLVIVGDTRTPDNYHIIAGLKNNTNVVFLSAHVQRHLDHEFIRLMPFSSFARKNIGYLYAIQHGALNVFDFDDDNVLNLQCGKPVSPYLSLPKEGELRLRFFVHSTGSAAPPLFNPLPLMNPSIADPWPRGFPLELIKDSSSQMLDRDIFYGTINNSAVGVIQYTANHDPDVDAVYRLTRPIPLFFRNSNDAPSLLVPEGSYTPYNAQATLHTYDAFWGLLLPMSVPGRVSDIWRSYLTQKIMKELGLFLVYAPPK